MARIALLPDILGTIPRGWEALFSDLVTVLGNIGSLERELELGENFNLQRDQFADCRIQNVAGKVEFRGRIKIKSRSMAHGTMCVCVCVCQQLKVV